MQKRKPGHSGKSGRGTLAVWHGYGCILPRMTPMAGKRTDQLQLNRREVVTTALLVQIPLLLPTTSAQSADGRDGHGDQPADNREPRYRETAHVRTYYDRSRF